MVGGGVCGVIVMELSRSELSGVGIVRGKIVYEEVVQGEIILVGIHPGGKYLGRKFSGHVTSTR